MTAFKKMFGLAIVVSLAVHVTVLAAPVIFRTQANVQDDTGILTVELRKSETSQIEVAQTEPERTTPVSPEADQVKKETPYREETVTLGNREPRYRDYLRRVKGKIERRWTYPGKAFERGERGVTTVKFSINSGGALVANSIMGTSGYGLLDETALNVIRAAAPYDPLPREFNLSRLHIVASFHYNLGR